MTYRATPPDPGALPRAHATVWGRDRPAALNALSDLIAFLAAARLEMTSLNVVGRGSETSPFKTKGPGITAGRRSNHWAWALTEIEHRDDGLGQCPCAGDGDGGASYL